MIIPATLCYIRKDEYTLMLYRNKKPHDIHKKKWNGLGGKINPGETPEECVIREVKEESGLIIKKPLFKGFILFPEFDTQNDWYVFVFVVKEFEGSLKKECEEGTLHWIKTKELPKLNLWEGDRIFLPWLDKEKFFSAKFVYKDEKLIEYTVNFY